MDTHFPGCTKIGNFQDPINDNLIRNTETDYQFNTKNILRSFKAEKAAGPDGIIPLVLHHLGPNAISIIEDLYKVSLETSYIPKLWCETKVIFLGKPTKDTYDNPSSFRPITL